MKAKVQQHAFANSLEHLLAALAYMDARVQWAVARAQAHGLNPDDDYRGLYISDAQVEQLMAAGVGHTLWTTKQDEPLQTNGQVPPRELLEKARSAWVTRTAMTRHDGPGMRLDRLIQLFGLSAVETDALLLILAPDIDPRYEKIYSFLQDDITKKRPTVDLILNLLTDSFEEKLRLRKLFDRDSALVGSRLVSLIADGAGREPGLLSHFVRPAGMVVEYLLGEDQIDARIAHCAQLFQPDAYVPSPRLPVQLAARLSQATVSTPLLAFSGVSGTGRREAGLYLAHECQVPMLHLDAAVLKESDLNVAEGVALALRDGRLLNAILYVNNWDAVLNDGEPPIALLDGLFQYPQIVVVAGTKIWQPHGRLAQASVLRDRPVFPVPFESLDFEARQRVWQHHLPASDVDLTPVANNFRFTAGRIEDAIATARDLALWENVPLAESHLFAASRAHSNQRLAGLATKIVSRYRWDDIVLPEDTSRQLREMVNMVQQRGIVYSQWGFEAKLSLGKGLYALFAGEPGTGKTMSAEIMAGELGLDLYKIDLSTLVSKYIGETEKNLDKIFTEAATSNAILFFDEADAIFGKRSEVKDSHDRYANIEVSYLLQRMESYDGIVILATNLRANMDEAFTRRLHFAIEFPFPEPVDREYIWRVTFPKDTPVDASVDFPTLAHRFRIAGGNIKNVILGAAFLAAETRTPVNMSHLMHAARREYQKMGRLIDERQFASEYD